MMFRIQIALLLTVALLSSCGEVTVFGHVVREAPKTSETKADLTPASAPAQAPLQAPESTVSTPATTVTTPTTTSTVATTQKTATAPTTTTAATSVIANESVKAPAIQQVKEVTLFIAPQVADKIIKDSRFNKDALLNAIKAELQSRKLIDTTDSKTGVALEVYIDNYDLHPNTNFVIFGFTANTGTLAGNLTLHDEQGNAFPRFHIEAHARISIPENGEAKNLLEPLYHEFAATVADSLTGIHTKSDADADQPSR